MQIKHPNFFKQANSTTYIGVTVVFLILIFIGSIDFWLHKQSSNAKQSVIHMHEVQTSLAYLLSELQDAETGQRGFLLTANDYYLEPYSNAIAKIDGVPYEEFL